VNVRLGRAAAACLLAGAVAIASTTPAAGRRAERQAQVPGTIRVKVTLVPVDVRVTDAEGKPVPDLTKDDFILFENGVRQQISHFSQETLVAHEPAPDEKVLLRKVPTFELAPQSARTFLIVLGRGRLQGPSKSIDDLIQFVRAGLLPQDRVAVFAYNRATDFTTNHEQVAQVLERFRKYHEGIEAKMGLRFSGLAAIYGSKDIPKSFQPDIEKIFVPSASSASLGSRQVPPGQITDASRLAQDARQVTDTLQQLDLAGATAMASSLDSVRADALTDLPFEDFVSTNASTMQDLQNLYTGVEYMRYIEGEKHLLFFTEQGLFLPRLENDKSLAALANDARVAIDTFQVGGVYADDIMAPPSTATNTAMPMGARGGGAAVPAAPRARGNVSRTTALSTLRNIADLTGGQSSIHAETTATLARLNESTRVQYLLGYYPQDTTWNGQYRRITVRVNRPGVRVAYRHGFYAKETLQPFDREAFLSYSRITAAGQYNGEVKDLKFKVRTSEAKNADGTPEIQVDLVIDVTHVRFQNADGRYQGNLHITTFYGDPRGRYLGGIWQEMALNLLPATYLEAQKSGLPYSARIPRRVQGQTLKVVIYDYNADLVGSVTATAKQN
jgi:VWFA-related protein